METLIESWFNRPNLILVSKLETVLLAHEILKYLDRLDHGLLPPLKIFWSEKGRATSTKVALSCAISVSLALCEHCHAAVPKLDSTHCLTVYCRGMFRTGVDISKIGLLTSFDKYLALICKIAGTEDLYQFSNVSKEQITARARETILEVLK